MKITVVGKSLVHSKKSDKDFLIVRYAYDVSGVDGAEVDKLFLDPERYPLNSLLVGGVYSADLDRRGNVMSLVPIGK